jgi:poly-beta-1,6-N-acetyl-D-glucosamine N-deacetylase
MCKKWLLMICLLFPAVSSGGQNSFITLCYHDVKDQWDGDPMTVSTDLLIAQFSWLKGHNYHIISIQDLLDAREGRKPLPDKAVLLSFDDGYVNFYRRIFPLLKMFGYTAVFAVVTQWMETPGDAFVQYGRHLKSRKDFLSWEQVREMVASGLVEIASHSDNLHHGVLGNPQGNKQPAAVTRRLDLYTGKYEADRAYQQRIEKDLLRSADVIQQRLGDRPRVMVWPYGAYSKEVVEIAENNGFQINLALGRGKTNLTELSAVNRYLIQDNPSLSDFVYGLTHIDEEDPIRVAHVDMDYIYDNDPEQINKNLSLLLDRIKAMRINTVYLQAFADPDGDGNADALYFPNQHLPVRADLFNRVAWQLQTRAKVKVYAWMPVLSFAVNAPKEWWVHEWKDGQIVPSTNNYKRLSPFHAGVRGLVADIYRDLAKYAHFSGLLFHDDAFLTDFEDASPAAREYLQGMDAGQKVSTKISVLTQFTEDLANTVRYYRPEIETARNLYARLVLQPNSSEWFAQSFPDFLRHYDYTAIMAMPYMENAEKPLVWLRSLVDQVAKHPGALRKTIFELQTVDWRTQEKLSTKEISVQIRLLQNLNAMNIGYYPDDFYLNHPNLKILKSTMSLQTFPFGQ